MPKLPQNAAHWLPIAEMARVVGLSVPRFRALHERLGRPCEEKRGRSKTSPIYINAPAWLARWKRDGAEPVGGFDDRWKKARAEKAEFELAQARGEVLTVDDATAAMQATTEAFRAALEAAYQIDRRAGDAAVAVLDDFLGRVDDDNRERIADAKEGLP